MTAFHICDIQSKSGIACYAAQFHSLVLEPLGYVLMRPQDISVDWITAQPAETQWHVQLGAMQFEERFALSRLLSSGARNIDATLHDPPFLTFPFFPFKSPTLMKLSRGFDWYFGSLGLQRHTLRKLRTAYVLTEKGRVAVLKAKKAGVSRIPHIVDPKSIWPTAQSGTGDVLYFGFIGPAKGLDYALELHKRIIRSMPDVRMHVVGDAAGASEQAFLRSLKERFSRQVTFHGYVPEDRLDELFRTVRHVFLPFHAYRYFHPASGSVINGMRRGRVVWSTAVNSVPELIRHGENGLLLTRDLDTDAALFCRLTNDQQALNRIGEAALESARAMSSYPYASHFASSPAI